MKLAISNIAWSLDADEQMYSFLKAEGFQGLEIAPTRIISDNPYEKLEQAIDFKDLLKSQYGLAIPSMQSICFGKSEAIFGTELERNTIKDHIKKAIDFATAVECNNLVFGCPKNRIIGENQLDIALSFFDELASYAFQKNTVLAMEPNPVIYGTNFLNTTAEAIDFVKIVNNEGLKLNVDLGTIIQNEEQLTILEKNLDLINHIHISEPYLEPIMKRKLHNELYEILVANNYANFVSIEMKNSNDLSIVKNAIYYINDVFKRK